MQKSIRYEVERVVQSTALIFPRIIHVHNAAIKCRPKIYIHIFTHTHQPTNIHLSSVNPSLLDWNSKEML